MFKTKEFLNLVFAGLVSVGAAGCASNTADSGWTAGLSDYVPSFIKPYRQDIQQGNIVTQEEVDRLKIGMSKDQVRFVLGTPLLNDPFHSDRWDYVFMLDRAEGETTKARYTVIFENGALARHGGENIPESTGEIRQQDKRERRKIDATEKEATKAETQDTKQTEVGGTEKAPELK